MGANGPPSDSNSIYTWTVAKAATFEGLLFAHSAVVTGTLSNNNFCQQRERFDLINFLRYLSGKLVLEGLLFAHSKVVMAGCLGTGAISLSSKLILDLSRYPKQDNFSLE